ncbi:hypothetical protein Daesc_000298 [Daldinia eschscholtzii]|uniref:Uncharacterized protein n=1 Tax=Daldinia eschscholtzii TaxID=292717 RepID=A0AAX6MZ92_9PEZI
MGHSRCFSTYDDDFEFDDAYFRQFYKPLSNLPTPPPSSKNSSAAQSPRITSEDVDSVSPEFLASPPEVIILAALIIADKFVEDLLESTQYYASVWGQNLWTCEQINFTERCIMENLGYRILPLWEAKSIKQARHDIEMARRELINEDVCAGEESKLAKHGKSMSSGHAVVGLGIQPTPAGTPKSEMTTPFGHTHDLGVETREAFSNPTALPRDYLHLPSTT